MLSRSVFAGLAMLCFTTYASQTAGAEEAIDEAQAPAKKESGAVIYGGLGSAKDASFDESGDTPWSVGGYFGEKYIVGIDLAGEGTKIDNTNNLGGAVTQGLSVNAILGVKALNGDDFKVDVGALLGGRHASASCPSGQSYLGYQCYADTDPSVSWEINYGAILTLSYKAGLVGVRATGESTQVVLGIRF
jgi:hypothetical protein